MEPKFKVGDKVREPESEYNIGDVVEILPRIARAYKYRNSYSDYMATLAGKQTKIISKSNYNTQEFIMKDDGYSYKLEGCGECFWASSMFKKAEAPKEVGKPLEPAVGEVFEHEGKRYICIEKPSNEDCRNCAFSKEGNCDFIKCTRKTRCGNKSVYYIEIPYIFDEQKASNALSDLLSAFKLIGSTPSFVDIAANATESKKDSSKSIIEYIMELNKKPNYKLKFKL